MKANIILTVSFLFSLSGLFTSCSNQRDLKKEGLKGEVKSTNESSYKPKNAFGIWESDGAVFFSRKMIFDEKGNCIEIQVGSDRIIPKYENGLKIEAPRYENNGELMFTDKYRRISNSEIEYDRFRNGEKVTNFKAYYKKGRLSKEICTGLDGTIRFETSYVYDENENLLEENTKDEKGEQNITYKYIAFDSKNNWTKQLIYRSKNKEEPSAIVIRQIEYYDGENSASIISEKKVINTRDMYLGNWHSNKYSMSITREGETFIIDVKKTSGWEGLQGKYTAKLVGKNLKVDISLLGELVLSDAENKIYWAGDEWQKVN